jgi:hypothetical protein
MLLKGSVVLRRREGRYRPPDGGAARRASLLESNTRASALFVIDLELGSVSELDALTGSTREYLEVTPRKKAKLLRVEPGQLRLERYRPPRGSKDAPLEEWEPYGKKTWPRPEDDAGHPPLYDYYALIAHLADLPLSEPGDRASVWMASSTGPVELEIRVQEERRRERVLVDLARDRERRVRLRELLIGLRPLRGEGEKVRGFLQMEGETELWVEAESGTLLEVRGRVPRVGLVSVELRGIR